VSDERGEAVGAPAPTAPPRAAAKPRPALSGTHRRNALLGIGTLVLLAGAAYGLYWNQFLRHHESTDNAYVQAPMVQITPQIGGTVTAVLVNDTDIVRPGQLLVQLDPMDARLALQRAQAALAQAVRQVRTLYAGTGSADAQVQLRRAEVASQRAAVARAQDDLARRQPLVASGAVSAEDLQHARSTFDAARSTLAAAESAVAAAQQQALGNLALTDGTRIDQHPNVLAAAAALREAWLALQRTELRAPQAGQVARRTVQLGQRVAAGAPLMSVVALDQLWVEANFKEGQLRDMHIGQPARLEADLYGDRVEFKGRIVGLGAGTGSAFALLPTQNATGNWIKVVQRVPVRIELDRGELARHPLRVGLSMRVTVALVAQAALGADGMATAQSAPNDGTPVPMPAAAAVAAHSADPTSDTAPADKMVRDIIAANQGPARRR
jgi:membrane fusion protein (multidrug efflux system)